MASPFIICFLVLYFTSHSWSMHPIFSPRTLLLLSGWADKRQMSSLYFVGPPSPYLVAEINFRWDVYTIWPWSQKSWDLEWLLPCRCNCPGEFSSLISFIHLYSSAGEHCVLYTLRSFDHLVPETILLIKDRILWPKALEADHSKVKGRGNSINAKKNISWVILVDSLTVQRYMLKKVSGFESWKPKIVSFPYFESISLFE